MKLGLLDLEELVVRWRVFWRILLWRRWIALLVIGVLVLFLSVITVIRLALAGMLPLRSSMLYLVLLVVVCRAHYERSIGLQDVISPKG